MIKRYFIFCLFCIVFKTQAQVEYVDTSRSLGFTKPNVNDLPMTKMEQSKEKSKGLFSMFKKSNNKNSSDSSKTIKSDSTLKISSKIKPDSAKIASTKNELKKFSIGGQATADYQYGFIPYLMNESVPAGFYRMYGDVQVQTGMLPWNVGYNYSSIGALSGINNYVKVSFDVERYKQLLKQKRGMPYNLDSMKLKSLDLEQQKEDLVGKQYFYKSLLDVNNLGDFNRMLSDTLPIPTLGLDSLALPNASLPDSMSVDTAGQFAELQKKKKELADKMAQVDQKIKQVESSIEQTEQAYAQAKSLIQVPSTNILNPEQALGKVKKLDIGLSNPNLSPLFLNGISVQGVHLELEDKHFLSITHGLTVAPILFSLNPLQNQLQYTRNVFNFFDFGNVGQGQRITAIKGGYGTKMGKHLHVGLLQGIGRSIVPSANDAFLVGGINKNYVIELDAKIMLADQHSLEMFYDKSYFHQDPTEKVSLAQGFKRIISLERSNAAMVRHSIQIPLIKSRFTSTLRWIDPYFKNFGTGFLRSDNVRYEIASEHTLSKKVALTMKYRKEQDNLLNLYSYHNALTTFGGQVKYKVLKGLTWVSGYYPILHKIEDATMVRWNKSFITNSVLTYSLQSQKVSQVYSLAYNHVLLSTDTMNSQYQTAQLNYELGFTSGLRFFASGQWFEFQYPDSARSQTWFASVGNSFTLFKDLVITSQLKYSITAQNTKGMLGYGLKITKKIMQNTDLELQADKLIQGDFYNSIIQNQHFGNFPYLFNVKLTHNF